MPGVSALGGHDLEFVLSAAALARASASIGRRGGVPCGRINCWLGTETRNCDCIASFAVGASRRVVPVSGFASARKELESGWRRIPCSTTRPADAAGDIRDFAIGEPRVELHKEHGLRRWLPPCPHPFYLAVGLSTVCSQDWRPITLGRHRGRISFHRVGSPGFPLTVAEGLGPRSGPAK